MPFRHPLLPRSTKGTPDAPILAIQFPPLMTFMYDASKRCEGEPDITLDTSNWRAVPNHSRTSSGFALQRPVLYVNDCPSEQRFFARPVVNSLPERARCGHVTLWYQCEGSRH